ncbi:MAG: diphthine synthase [Candidatus Micrarchaeota archaeon]
MENTLYLAGLGLCDETDLPIRTIEILRKCGNIFLEDYTNLVREGTAGRLGKIIGKKVEVLAREQVEGEKIILQAAQNGDTALIVPGDPMVATTHNSLLQAARERKIRTKILHASSIFSAAAGAAGLQIYKFGKTATITFWRKNYEPDSFVDLIANNQKIGAHTLCLLDIDNELGAMRPKYAIEILLEAQKRKICRGEIAGEIIGADTKIFVVSHVGWEDEEIWSGKISEYKDELVGPAVVIIPSKMHFMEEKSYEGLRE